MTPTEDRATPASRPARPARPARPTRNVPSGRDTALVRLVQSKRRELDLLRDSLEDASADQLPPITDVLDELADLSTLSIRLERMHAARTTTADPAATALLQELAHRAHRLGQVAAALRRLSQDDASPLNARLSNMAARLFQLAARLEPEEGPGVRPTTLARARADLQVGFGQLMTSLRGEISDLLAPRVYLPASTDDPLDATAVVVQSLAASLVLAVCVWAATFLPAGAASGPFVQSA